MNFKNDRAALEACVSLSCFCNKTTRVIKRVRALFIVVFVKTFLPFALNPLRITKIQQYA